MGAILDFPVVVFVVSIVTLWGSTLVGDLLRKRVLTLRDGERDEFNVTLTATLTLLVLIIGFSFSMAISRYDQRKNYEEAEANAIGTAYVRADLLPSADAARVRELLRKYVDQRLLFYTIRDQHLLQKVNAATAQLQADLWSAILPAAVARPTPTVALVISGMNDVLNSQGYTQAAWWNRIPVAAWALMGVIAICCNVMLGYYAHETNLSLFLMLPIVASTSFFLIADIDSPNGGVIRVLPQNLTSFSQSLSVH